MYLTAYRYDNHADVRSVHVAQIGHIRRYSNRNNDSEISMVDDTTFYSPFDDKILTLALGLCSQPLQENQSLFGLPSLTGSNTAKAAPLWQPISLDCTDLKKGLLLTLGRLDTETGITEMRIIPLSFTTPERPKPQSASQPATAQP